ncbi:hypothetical protein ONZ45_g16980 [Pleurotus djamor]|nr:hypothetical protein ONZ45_g16980 [Pleurotus djamor]
MLRAPSPPPNKSDCETEIASIACPGNAECTLAIDVVLKCGDDTLLGCHQRNFYLYSTKFPKPGTTDSDDGFTTNAQVHLRVTNTDGGRRVELPIINVEENREVVETLIKFMHRQAPPDVSSLSWDDFAVFTKAVEKYGVFGAMGVCRMKMEYAMEEHAYEVYKYAKEGGYEGLRAKAAALIESRPAEALAKACDLNDTDEMNKTSLRTLDLAMEDIVTALQATPNWTRYFSAWVGRESFSSFYLKPDREWTQAQQREQMFRLRRNVIENPPWSPCSEIWDSVCDAIRVEYHKQGGVDLDKAVAAQEDAKSKRVRIAVDHWRSAYTRVERSVPPFCSYL